MASHVPMGDHKPERAPEPTLDAAIDKLTLRSAKGSARTSPRSAGFSRILVAVDDTPGAKVALHWAREIASATGASVRVVTIVIPPHVAGYDGGGYAWWPQIAAELDRAHETERAAHDAAMAELERAGVRTDGVFLSGSPVAEIARIANEHKADLVILGSHNRSAMGRALLGSVADGVKNHVTGCVLIAKTEPPARRILVPVDGSEPSKRAAAVAMQLAREWGVDTSLLHVLDLGGASRPTENALADVVRDIPDVPSPSRLSYALVPGAPAERIVEEAREREAGLIVMGSRGLGRLRSLVSGSVSSRVAHTAPMSVMLVKEADA